VYDKLEDRYVAEREIWEEIMRRWVESATPVELGDRLLQDTKFLDTVVEIVHERIKENELMDDLDKALEDEPSEEVEDV